MKVDVVGSTIAEYIPSDEYELYKILFRLLIFKG